MCIQTLFRPQLSEVISAADTITITVKVTEERGWALGGGRNASFESPMKKTTMWGYIVPGMWFKVRNQCDRKRMGRLFLCYNSWLLSKVFYNALNFICNCSDLFHLSKASDLCQKPFQSSFFFFSCATSRCIRRANSDFHLSTLEKQRNCFFKRKEKETFSFPVLKAKVWTSQEEARKQPFAQCHLDCSPGWCFKRMCCFSVVQ